MNQKSLIAHFKVNSMCKFCCDSNLTGILVGNRIRIAADSSSDEPENEKQQKNLKLVIK